ncbi:LETM1 and EF-hand domain-containing mitochondrial [Chlorella sorokiniana]|uniref:Mitochondrial proton/calcium exchanger protein n=1 Tax=Chlorella sorokiniana TaxID=3076 RepID=A0A2P6TW92_CHLSO|nr:LETM1 and EF-hand domain-containing mitochondrial [Chlorella sorokiniana]|eukprot:PRW58330.1 LETM1 and EF-hand domain-containing mitochondrial [Chlorella sorokiniana]
MATRRWVGSALGVYRLLLEQQAAGGGAGAAAARQLWQAELSLALRPSSTSSSGGAPAQLHTAVSLRAWLPAAAQAGAGVLPSDLRQRRQPGEEQQQQARSFSLHREEPVRSQLTQRPPLQEMTPWDSLHVPHQHAPHGAHARPATGAAKYEEVDKEDIDEVMEEYSEARRRVRKLQQLPPGHVPLKVRLTKLGEALAHGTKVTLVFLVTAPGKIARFYMQPRAERKATYARWWGVVKKEAKHYWVGTKLLAADVKIASRLLGKVVHGKTLTRRERAQLTRTAADLFRLVPMLVFVVVPFMELLLPVALKLFPNMLPSTFEDKLKKEEEMKRRIGARMELARFLQDTVAEMASDMQKRSSGETATSAEELYHFMQRIRAGEDVPVNELLRFSKLFNDELTLDNLERVQLVSLCRFVGIQPFGTDAFLRSRLRRHLMEIKEDDQDIQEEGVDSLTEDELRQACRARGMRAPFGEGSSDFMRQQLTEWIDWSLNKSLPSSLLLLSRAFTVTQPLGRGPRAVDVHSLRETLSTLPDEAVEDVELFETAASGDKTEAIERKLELLEREEEMIKEEEAIAAELPVTAGASDARTMAAAAAAAAVVREAAAAVVAEHLEGQSEEEKSLKAAEAKKHRMRKVITALAHLASASGVSREREEFMELVEKEIERLEGQLETRGVGMVFTKGALEAKRQAQLEHLVGAKRLEDRVAGILARVERELDDAETKIGDKLKVLDTDRDGVISTQELAGAMGFLREQMGEEELRHLLEMLSVEAGKDGGIDVNKLMELADVALEEEEEERELQ